MLRFIVLCFALAALPQVQVFAQSSTGCESMQTEEEYQKCIERSGKPREMNPQIFGQGNSNVPTNQPLQQDIMDALPPESQRHVRSEMAKKVYAEVGEWTPEARAEEFDYEPSAAAKGDPELRAEEEAVFAAAVSDYHDREEIAYQERQSGGANGAASDDESAPETASQAASRAGRDSTPGQSRSAMDILGDLNVADNDGSGAGAEASEDDATISASGVGNAAVVGDPTLGALQGEDGDEGDEGETGQPAGASGSEMQAAQETQPGQDAQTDTNMASADADITDADSTEETSDTDQQEQDAAAQEQQNVAENAGIAGPAGEERSALDIFGELSDDDAPGGDVQSSQTQSAETQSAETQSAETQSAETQSADSQGEQNPGTQNNVAQRQSDTQTQTATSGTPSSQRRDSNAGSSPPPAPTRPIPKTDAISAQFLSRLFEVENDQEPTASAAPFEDWSNPDSAERNAIETAAQTVLETPEDLEIPIEPTTPSQSVRVLEKETARLSLKAQTVDAGPSEQASLEAEIAEGQSALQTLSAASEAELRPPPAQVTNRLSILGLP